MVCGIYTPDGGEILYEGAPYSPQSPLDAIRAGIRVVYQEFNLLPYLSVAENIFFERLPQRGGLVDFRTLYRQAQAVLDEVGLDVSPRTPVELLGVAQTQLIEIAKAISNREQGAHPRRAHRHAHAQGDRPPASRSSPASRAAA